jgi:hypothetical protein
MSITVKSLAFVQGSGIPAKYTCDGRDVSPPLEWTAAPATTKSYAVIVDDPDAPRGTFTHWVLFNIPSRQTKLEEGVPTAQTLSNGAKQGKNDAGSIGYYGPCPPTGIHRYRFKVYALDAMLNLKSGVTVGELEKAMGGHVIAQGELMGKYARI